MQNYSILWLVVLRSSVVRTVFALVECAVHLVFFEGGEINGIQREMLATFR